jgi:hypothetical protein
LSRARRFSADGALVKPNPAARQARVVLEKTIQQKILLMNRAVPPLFLENLMSVREVEAAQTATKAEEEHS